MPAQNTNTTLKASTMNLMPIGDRQTTLQVLRTVCLAWTIACCMADRARPADAPVDGPQSIVDFERHIAPLFSRLGCNSASCHGAFGGGKGGLQLSLFGYSPEMDYRAVEDRTDRSDAASSLLLLKPSGQEPHEGGMRFKPNSKSYRTIRRWIEQGAIWKKDSSRVTQLTVDPPQIVFGHHSATTIGVSKSLAITAEFADGTRELVTHLCQFTSRDEGIASVKPNGTVIRSSHGDTSIIVSFGNAFASVSVLAPFPDLESDESAATDAPSHSIDGLISEKLAQLRMEPSRPASDEEFLRRVTIDTIGSIPSPEDVTTFCADTHPNKREQKIDELLAHPMHAALWATRMCDITKCDVGSMGENELLAARRAQMWHDWFRKRFENNTSYAQIVRGVVASTSREGLDVLEWMQREEQLIHRSRESFHNEYAERDTLDLYWRRVGADSEATLKANAELTAAAFMGIRLNCAQCHKHPFDRWTQDDYAAFANIFSRVVFGGSTEVNAAILDELERRRRSKREGKTVKALPRMREVFVSADLGRGIGGSEPGIDVSPRALDGQHFEMSADLRQQFCDWLIADNNPYFARNFVNRVWAAYFGIGLVDPVDNFSVTNPPSHPKLLDKLAQRFCESNFDIHDLERYILTSDAYQRTSTPNASNRNDRRNFARQYLRPLLAEVALDAINKALGTTDDFGKFAPQGALAIEVGTNQLQGDAERALQVLGRGKRESICDCDRRTESDLRQFMFLINDESIAAKIKRGSIRKLLSCGDDQLVRELYLRILGRKPTAAEIKLGVEHLKNANTRDVAFDDLIWALLNTREFITNH